MLIMTEASIGAERKLWIIRVANVEFLNCGTLLYRQRARRYLKDLR